MLTDILLVLGLGFLAGELAHRCRIPALVGMILVGILLGEQVTNVLSQNILLSADSLRTIAVMVILMKAGLGLDRQKLSQQGTVALRLGFLPGICEAIAVAVLAHFCLGFNWTTGLLLGTILGAESPAVIVPGMLRLKSLGWGVKKGIPDAILTGSALSDVLLLLVFSLLVTLLSSQQGTSAWQTLPLQVLVQIGVAIAMGWLSAKILVLALVKQKWTRNAVQDNIVTTLVALLLVVLAYEYPFFSGYLAVMSAGFFLIEFSAPLARRLRIGFDILWQVAQIFLFVLLGANIPLNVLRDTLIIGLVIIIAGTLIGRMLGWFLATWKSNWTLNERLFLLPGNSAKATVQAAVGAIPLAQGISGGEQILAIAALSILVTAPLGAWAIPTFAPRLLQKGEVDPTKVIVERKIKILTAIDNSSVAIRVLKKTADIARRSDADVLVVHILQESNLDSVEDLKQKAQTILADIHYQFLITEGSIAEEIVKLAHQHQVAEIVIGKRGHQPWEQILIGSVSQVVLETSQIPIIVVE